MCRRMASKKTTAIAIVRTEQMDQIAFLSIFVDAVELGLVLGVFVRGALKNNEDDQEEEEEEEKEEEGQNDGSYGRQVCHATQEERGEEVTDRGESKRAGGKERIV
eukprot:TRINITY_DN402_c0_g1_i5.p3 TRINITY_DN402_c0_g1~~TRINITY_DN402_c0_g1_i5.p3  ORF type:complete len:106 (-),score=37.72 TRINITY_DN402_c0_g1_i5:62-379(-)